MWGVRGQALSHPRLLALWAGCWGRCGASGAGRSPTPDCPPSGRAAGAGVGRPGSGALPPPTARPLGGLPGPVWGVRGRTLSDPRLLALWAGCRGRCGASGVGHSPTPDCPPSGRAARPVWGVRGQTLSHPRLPALWAGCRGRCGASGVGRSPTPDCPPSGPAAGADVGRGVGGAPTPDCSPSGRAAGAGVARPGSDALPAPTARPLGGLPGPVWGVRGRALSHPRLLALSAGCRGRCGASGVRRSPTPDCPPSGRAAGAGVGRPGSDALPPPTARPLGGLPGLVWGVRGRTLSHPRLPALWAGCRGRCGACGVGRSPTPDCPPSGRAAGAGVGRPGSGALPPPTARPLGGPPGPVWGVRGRTLSQPRLPALWAGCRGRCGASGVGRSPTPDCSPCGRAAGAVVGRPGPDALPPPTARPTLGGLPVPVWGVRGRTLSDLRLSALWAGCRGRCGASRVWRSPTPDCPPSRRAAGAGVGRPGSDALPPPTARPLGGLPGPLWGVRGRTLSHPRSPALWAGCRGRCGASGVGRSPSPDCSPSGRAAGAGVGRPGSDTLPPPTARPLGGLPVPVWGVRGRGRSHPRLLALRAGCRGRCGASGVGRSPTPDCPPSGRAAGAGVGRPGLGALPPPTARPVTGLPGPVLGVRGRALPPPTARPPGGLPLPVWGVRGRTLSHPRLPALWAGCRGRCGASGVGRSPTPDRPPSGRAARAVVGRPGSGALPPPPARPSGGLPGCCACACPAWSGGAGRPPGRVLVRLTFPLAFLAPLFACSAPSGLGLPCLWLLLGFFASCPPAPVFLIFFFFFYFILFFPSLPPLCAPRCLLLCVFSGLGCPRPWCPALVSLLVALVSCCSPVVLGSRPVPGRVCFCALPVRCCAGVPAPLLSVRRSLALAGLAGVLCCCLLCLCVCCWAWLSPVVSWWVLVAPGVVSRWRAVVCPWVLCCAVLLRVVPLGVALLCTVLFRFAPFGAAARRAVSWGAVLCLGVLCLLAPCFVLSPRAVCVLLWYVAAWCCSPLCFVPCAPWGVVLCVSCRLRPVRCCCVARSPSVPCFPVLCHVVLCCRVVPWCPVLPPCWVCFLRGCGCTYLKNRCKIS